MDKCLFSQPQGSERVKEKRHKENLTQKYEVNLSCYGYDTWNFFRRSRPKRNLLAKFLRNLQFWQKIMLPPVILCNVMCGILGLSKLANFLGGNFLLSTLETEREKPVRNRNICTSQNASWTLTCVGQDLRKVTHLKRKSKYLRYFPAKKRGKRRDLLFQSQNNKLADKRQGSVKNCLLSISEEDFVSSKRSCTLNRGHQNLGRGAISRTGETFFCKTAHHYFLWPPNGTKETKAHFQFLCPQCFSFQLGYCSINFSAKFLCEILFQESRTH